MPDVARIHTGRELLRGGEHGRDGLLVVLEVAQMLLAQRTIVGGDAHAVVRVSHRLALIDQVSHRQRVQLRRAENQRLLARVDGIHEDLHAVGLARTNLDEPIEVLLLVTAAGLDVALHDLVVGRVDVLVERGGDLPHLEGREEAVVDALLQ